MHHATNTQGAQKVFATSILAAALDTSCLTFKYPLADARGSDNSEQNKVNPGGTGFTPEHSHALFHLVKGRIEQAGAVDYPQYGSMSNIDHVCEQYGTDTRTPQW
jgi:hypothetical protein